MAASLGVRWGSELVVGYDLAGKNLSTEEEDIVANVHGAEAYSRSC